MSEKSVNSVRCADLFDISVPYIAPLFDGVGFPWEVLPKIGEYCRALLDSGMEGFREIMPGVLVGENVKIHPSAVIIGPAVIGAGTEIRPGAYLRGNVITGPDCVIGNSTEIKNSVLMRRVQAPHYNYIGDSVLGNGAHMGAGSICSNFKSDGTNIVIHGERDFDTGLRTIGAVLADGAEIGCGSVLNPGPVIGKRTTVYPLTPVRGVVPSCVIVKSATETVVKTEK